MSAPITPDPTVLAVNRELGRQYMRAFRDRDESWWDRFIAPEFVRHDPGLPFAVRGPAGLREVARFMHGAFSDVELPVPHVGADGDKVLVHLRMRGRHTGEFAGMPPTGRQPDVAVMDLFRVFDGRLVEHCALMDNLPTLRQVSAVRD